MRTTVRLDDALYRQVKALAATSGRTVGAVLEDAVRRGLERQQEPRKRYQVDVFIDGPLAPGVNLDSNADLIDALDAERSPDALR